MHFGDLARIGTNLVDFQLNQIDVSTLDKPTLKSRHKNQHYLFDALKNEVIVTEQQFRQKTYKLLQIYRYYHYLY